jgi:predicted cytidylate kinase
MIITISGPSGSGKSTVANALAKNLGLPAIDVGAVFREQAAKHKMNIVEFSDYRLVHPEIDREIDDAVIAKCQETPAGCVLQGRLSAWMTKQRGIKAIRLWIDASPEVRAARITNREGGDPAETLAGIKRRDANDWKNYRDTYGIDLNDLSVYDIVVPTDDRSAEQVISFILNEIQKYG